MSEKKIPRAVYEALNTLQQLCKESETCKQCCLGMEGGDCLLDCWYPDDFPMNNLIFSTDIRKKPEAFQTVEESIERENHLLSIENDQLKASREALKDKLYKIIREDLS